MVRHQKRVLIVHQADGYANGLRGFEIARFLRRLGHSVELVDTYYLSRATSARTSFRNRLPALGLRRSALYGVELLALVTRRVRLGRRYVSYYWHIADCRLRRDILARSLDLDEFDLVICETPYDALILTVPTTATTFYDCPTPWADELFDDMKLTPAQHERMRRFERHLFESVDYLAFHWESYAKYVLVHYGISGKNLITLNWGCTSPPARARFADPPRIVYIGSLASQYIDLEMLARLSALYPHLDVYGGPPPDNHLRLNYLGYASPKVLAQYQIGLVTSSRAPLRRQGFSAKHPEYLSYGLPVLVPEWRESLELLRGSVTYSEDTFLERVRALSRETEWERVSDEAYQQAQALAWSNTLRPLGDLIDEL